MTMIYKRSLIALGAAALLTLSGAIGAAAVPAMAEGGVLVDAKGMTLYVFDKDPAGAGKSACNDQCAQNWPPLTAGTTDKGSGDYTVLTRDDGSLQWAYKGRPLYLWVKDTKPGDKTGDGVKDVWHVAKP
jgi:predicted lipoprotein with Yx(FWY)xxD motif